MAFKIGLGAVGTAKKAAVAPRALFGDDDEDENASTADKAIEEVGGATIDSLKSSKSKALLDDEDADELPDQPKLRMKPKPGLPPSHFGDVSAQRASRKTQEIALETDASIYDYDAAFDAIHAKDAERKALRKKDADDRKSKYMDSFIASAELRKQDLARAKDKQLQREREAEGDEFADKEKFVTEAYKKQQEELRQAAEEEKKRQAEEEKKRKATGMLGFYQGVMDEQEKRYQETIKAAEEAAKTGKKIEIDAEREKTDKEIAEELRAQGKDVLLNEDGQIVDKRETLSAGLNIIKKARPASAVSNSASKSFAQPAWQTKAVGDRKGLRDRQTKMMEEQLAAAAKRAADEEAEEQRKLEHASKSRKTEGEISDAKSRYLARKKAAEEARKAKSSG